MMIFLKIMAVEFIYSTGVDKPYMGILSFKGEQPK